jgi:hypothetical protein
MTTLTLILALVQSIILSGTVWQSPGKPAANAEVKAVGSEGTFQTTTDKDGNFTFRLAKPDTFELRASLGKLTSQASTIFVGQDMGSVGIFLPPPPRPLVGSLKVDGEGPLPTPRPKIVVHYASGNVANRCDISDRGLFSCPQPAEFTVSLEGLPEPFYVKSVELVANRCDATTDIGRLLCRHPFPFTVASDDLPDSNFVKSIKLADGDLVKTPINVSADLSTSTIITLGFRK